MKKVILILSVFSMILLGGCSARIADLTIASTKNMDLSRGDFIKGKRVKGSSMVPAIIVPFGLPDLKSAIDSAVEKDPCAVGLSDAVIYRSNYIFVSGFKVKGDLIIDRGLNGCDIKNTSKSEIKKQKNEKQGGWY